MLLAIDKYFNKLASQEKSVRPKRIPSLSRSRNCDDYFEGEICFGDHDPKMFVRGRLCGGARSPFSKMSPAPRTRSRLRIDKYFNDCLEKEAQSKHKRHRLLLDEYLDNRREKAADSKPVRSRSMPKKGNWLMLDEYLENRLEKEAHSKLIRNRFFGKMLPDPKKRSRLRIDKYFDNCLEKAAHSKPKSNLIRNYSLIKPQEALMPRKKKEPEVVREYADATPRRSRVYVDGLSHALKDYAKANDLPVVEAIAAKLKWFMRFEDSLENFFVHGKADQHPDFNEYFSALIAQPHFRNLCGDEAASILKQEFKPKANPLMPNGYSCWASFHRTPNPLTQRALPA